MPLRFGDAGQVYAYEAEAREQAISVRAVVEQAGSVELLKRSHSREPGPLQDDRSARVWRNTAQYRTILGGWQPFVSDQETPATAGKLLRLDTRSAHSGDKARFNRARKRRAVRRAALCKLRPTAVAVAPVPSR
jgi:hypothetical protein